MSNPINNDVDSLPYVLAVSGASAQQLAERSLQLLLENDRHVHLILSRGAHEVWSAELEVHVPVEPEAQARFWRDRLKCSKGPQYRNDQAPALPVAVFARAGW